jgi:uncharacterized protein
MSAVPSREPRRERPTDPLNTLGIARSASRVLRYFALRPETAIHGRRLQRVLRVGAVSLQRDLERLVKLGALRRFRDGRLVLYQAESQSPLWPAFRTIIGMTSDPAGVVRDALCDVSGIEAAFIFGSTAKHARREDSDIDLFLLELPDLDSHALFAQLGEAGLLLKTEVNTIRYSTQSLAERLGDPNHAASHFIRGLLEGPKRWVAGDQTALRSLATAAGLRMKDDSPVQVS